MMVASKTEDYQLLGDVLDQGPKDLGYSREALKQYVLDLYYSKGQTFCYKFDWSSFRMAYRNPRFSELGKVLTKVALERGTGVLYWRSLNSPPPSCLTTPSTCLWVARGLLGNQDGEAC